MLGERDHGYLRDASIGAFWMIQAGAVAGFRALLPVEPLYETPTQEDDSEAAQLGAELAASTLALAEGGDLR